MHEVRAAQRQRRLDDVAGDRREVEIVEACQPLGQRLTPARDQALAPAARGQPADQELGLSLAAAKAAREVDVRDEGNAGTGSERAMR